MNHDKAIVFGKYIKQLRGEKKLSVRGLATKAGMDDGALSRIENGKRLPQAGTLKALASALDVPLADLFVGAGHLIPYDLPSITPYLRARYSQFPEEALTSLDSYLKQLIEEHGMDPNGPRGLEDETSELSQR